MELFAPWRSFAGGLCELLFEARCVLCRAPASESSAWLCLAHELREERLLRPTCPICALPSESHTEACRECEETPRPWLELAAALAYRGAGRELLLQAKLGHRAAYLRPLGAELITVLEAHAWAERACFVPVPLHRQRQRERGFNQAAVIARELAEHFRGRTRLLLRRVRATVPQGDPTTRDRASNVRGVFALRRFIRVPHSVVLVDDTSTSMATLTACAKVLVASGCRELYAAVVFRAGPRVLGGISGS